jgi:hypothetical protein
MERKQKTYQSTQFIQLDTYVLINGQKRLVEFRGGSLDPKRNGIYSTSDPEVIEQMDAYLKRIGPEKASYKCIHEEVLLEDEPVKKSETREVPEVTTVTAAKQWLVDASEKGEIKEGITPNQIKNRTDVLRIAQENGINFIDLPRE